MKSTIVPAQITTVEDQVAGSLTLIQLLLLTAPAFVGAGIYVLLPPMLGMSPYKVVLAALVALVFGLMAIRVKGRILLLWLIILLRYNLRPRYHVFNKNELHLRDIERPIAERVAEQEEAAEKLAPEPLPQLSVAEVVQVEKILTNPQANLRFLTDKKGALHVRFNEVE